MSLRFNRRTALKSLGALAATRALPGCSPHRPPPLSELIDTVVVLMMENRTFDHYFGALSLVEGRTDVDGLRADMKNLRTDGTEALVHPADQNCIDDPPHSWNPSHDAFNNGLNDGFVRGYERVAGADSAHRVMGYFDRNTLSASYALADEYSLCQRWFASLMSSTWPNRFYLLAGQSGGVKSNDLGVHYDFPNVLDAFTRKGLSYGVYYGNLAFSLLFTRNYPRENFRDYDQFFEDAAAGTLPNLVLIDPIFGRSDDHPPTHPLAGQVFIAGIYEALAASPQWNRCLFIITYDEHGGFFDHVPPPKTEDAHAAEGFDQLGFRVPSQVIGPYVRKGFVSDTIYDHASVLATLRTIYDIDILTRRQEVARDLVDVLDPDRIVNRAPRPPAAIPEIIADESVIYSPDCVFDFMPGLARASGATGQPELEQYFDAHPELAWADRRKSTDRIFESFLARAEKRRIIRRTTR